MTKHYYRNIGYQKICEQRRRINPGIIFKTSMRSILSALIICSIVAPGIVLAETSPYLSITPAVIDEKAKPRDILHESITLTNTTDHLLNLFPSVYDVSTVNGQEIYSYAKDASDLAASLANWMEISRGAIELSPGQSKVIPLTIRVNLNARPGQYHAQISFSEGSTLDDARSRRSLTAASINLEIQADIKEIMQLGSFSSDNIVLAGDDVVFKYKLQNIGNQELQPTGDIRIYNRKGEEVASVDVNKAGKLISPDKETQLASVWSGASGFGKFKALLTINYGKGQSASVQDTVFFWIIPWKQLLGLIAASLIAIAFFALHFHRWFEERHLHKLAAAGLLKTGHISNQTPHVTPVAVASYSMLSRVVSWCADIAVVLVRMSSSAWAYLLALRGKPRMMPRPVQRSVFDGSPTQAATRKIPEKPAISEARHI